MEIDFEPDYFVCPFYKEIMEEPVMTTSGMSYEKNAIVEWIKRGNLIDPMTGQRIKNFVIPNINLKKAIQSFQKANFSFLNSKEKIKIDIIKVIESKEEQQRNTKEILLEQSLKLSEIENNELIIQNLNKEILSLKNKLNTCKCFSLSLNKSFSEKPLQNKKKIVSSITSDIFPNTTRADTWKINKNKTGKSISYNFNNFETTDSFLKKENSSTHISSILLNKTENFNTDNFFNKFTENNFTSSLLSTKENFEFQNFNFTSDLDDREKKLKFEFIIDTMDSFGMTKKDREKPKVNKLNLMNEM